MRPVGRDTRHIWLTSLFHGRSLQKRSRKEGDREMTDGLDEAPKEMHAPLLEDALNIGPGMMIETWLTPEYMV